MSAGDKVFAGSIPENYDRYMVPLIFESYARDIARRAAALSPKAVLETASGSGVVTRALAPELSPDASYVVTDLNQPMLDYAATRQEQDTASPGARPMRRRCRSKMPPSIWFAASSASCSSRPPSAYREARRVLKPGGCFPVQRMGPHRGKRVRGRCDQRARGIFSERSAALHGAHAARLSRHRADPERSGEGRLFERHDRNQGGESRAPSPRQCRVAYCQGTPLRNEIEARGADKLEAATEHAASAIARKHGSGEVAAKIQAHVILAWI
jgi:SAM-dependent methyltransferase